jgi:hypothetical protein
LTERDFLKDAKVHLYKVKDGHLVDFLDCVKSRQKTITNEIVGARSAICCHLLNLAYYHQQVIKWDPDKCAFTDGTGNPEWLKGSRRDYTKTV